MKEKCELCRRPLDSDKLTEYVLDGDKVNLCRSCIEYLADLNEEAQKETMRNVEGE